MKCVNPQCKGTMALKEYRHRAYILCNTCSMIIKYARKEDTINYYNEKNKKRKT